MLRATTTTTDQEETVILKLEGKLAGPWVEEVTRVWEDLAQESRQYVVDLRSITFIDGTGKRLLAAMWRRGAQLVASDCCTRNIVDEIQREVVGVRS
jgi:anti-anti-sigma regulatory factor